jgi:hypothetical protein
VNQKDQFVFNNLVEKEAIPQDRFLMWNEEELSVNDIVKIHTKYFKKDKNVLGIQMKKRKRRKKYKGKKR